MHSRHEGRKKRQADDNIEDPDLAKKRKHAAEFDSTTTNVEDSQLRPSRTGAGSGGRIAQLERIGAVLEAAQKRNPRTTLADDIEQNPLAPASLESTVQKGVCSAQFRSNF